MSWEAVMKFEMHQVGIKPSTKWKNEGTKKTYFENCLSITVIWKRIISMTIVKLWKTKSIQIFNLFEIVVYKALLVLAREGAAMQYSPPLWLMVFPYNATNLI